MRSIHFTVFATMVIAVATLAIGVSAAFAQGIGISVSAADSDAAAQVLASGHYGAELTPPRSEMSKGSAAFMRIGEAANAPAASAGSNPSIIVPKNSWGPVDLGYYGGSTLTYATQWNVYLGCPSNDQSCWGDPEQFITDLNGSKFIHVVDQYVGTKKRKRYPLADAHLYNGSPVGTFLGASDIIAWLHAAVGGAGGASAAGPGNLFHIYLNAGIDTCIDDLNMFCYSPDNFPTFYFCGYHEYVDFMDYGRVYFTVEPYQAVYGCYGSATSDLTSATANVLSHEIFETITDPNLDAWFGTGNPLNNFGEEIGDECSWLNLNPQRLHRRHPIYVIQNEYSNKYHACVNKP
jgi:hypothetical protein